MNLRQMQAIRYNDATGHIKGWLEFVTWCYFTSGYAVLFTSGYATKLAWLSSKLPHLILCGVRMSFPLSYFVLRTVPQVVSLGI